MSAQRWEHFEHEADIGVRGYGDSIAQAFEQTALALSSVITDLNNIEEKDCIEVACSAPENDVLLVDWLNELIFQMATRQMLFATFQVSINDHQLSARVCGERVDQKKHQPAVEIKGATFTELTVRKNEDNEWVAQCIVDV